MSSYNITLSCSRLFLYLSIVTLTLKINRGHHLIMGNMCIKFNENTLNSLVSIVFTRLCPYLSIVTLTFDLWSWKSIGFIVSSWAICVLSLIKIHSMVWSLLCSQGYFNKYPLWPWPLTLKIKMVLPLIMGNTCSKFDENTLNGLVSIVFTRLCPYFSIVTLTSDLKNQ